MIQIAHNATVAKLVNASKEAKLEVQKILSYKVQGAEHMGGGAGWDGRASFFQYTQGTFPAGFVNLVQAGLIKAGYKVGLVRKPLPAALGPEMPVVDDFGYDPIYDYQPQVMQKLERFGQIIAQVATGGGKSRIAKMCFARINRPTLFLTTRGVLMHQMKDAFERDLKTNVAVFGDGQWGHINSEGKPKLTKFSVGMVQTFASRLEETTPDMEYDRMVSLLDNKELTAGEKLKVQMKKEGAALGHIRLAVNDLILTMQKQRPGKEVLRAKAKLKAEKQMRVRQATIELLAKFEFVILEEAHESSGDGFYNTMRQCKNANYRLALTATPFMKDDEEANMRLMAVSGPVAIRVSEDLLIKRGILAKPIFKYIPLREVPDDLKRSTPWQRAYKNGIVKNEFRNQAVVGEVKRAASYGLTSIILVQHTEHGTVLQDQLTNAGLRVKFIHGEHEQSERKEALRMLGNGELDGLIGSTVLDVGVDVPSVGLVANCGGGKAEVALRQRIGRGLRSKKRGPNVALIIDFQDEHNSHLRQHARQRRMIVETTAGFNEGILMPGEDFNYEKLGFELKRAA